MSHFFFLLWLLIFPIRLWNARRVLFSFKGRIGRRTYWLPAVTGIGIANWPDIPKNTKTLIWAFVVVRCLYGFLLISAAGAGQSARTVMVAIQ
jgi:hypothetical protein